MSANLHVHIGKVNPFTSFRLGDPIQNALARKMAANSDHIWVGEACFLKALVKKQDSYIPPFVQFIVDLFPPNQVTLITDELVKQVRNFSKENETAFADSEPKVIAHFLAKHIDCFAYSVTW